MVGGCAEKDNFGLKRLGNLSKFGIAPKFGIRPKFRMGKKISHRKMEPSIFPGQWPEKILPGENEDY